MIKLEERNLLEDIIHEMDFHNYNPKDIKAIVNKTNSCNWKQFKKIADNTGFPNSELEILFKNGDRFLRAERKFGYGEGWELVKAFKMPISKEPMGNTFMIPRDNS